MQAFETRYLVVKGRRRVVFVVQAQMHYCVSGACCTATARSAVNTKLYTLIHNVLPFGFSVWFSFTSICIFIFYFTVGLLVGLSVCMACDHDFFISLSIKRKKYSVRNLDECAGCTMDDCQSRKSDLMGR